MNTYGANKATEFSKKQIGVIYRLAKTGELNVEQFVMSNLYNMADYYGYDDNHSVEREEKKIIDILALVFDKDLEGAQKAIDEYTEWLFDSLSAKYQRNANRELVK